MKINADISARISELIDYLHLNPNSFAKKLHYERSQVVYDILKGKALPSSDFYIRLKNSEYSDVSIEWLITGKGEMLQGNIAESINKEGVACTNCHYKKMADGYEKLVDRLTDENNRLLQQLNTLRHDDQPKTKRRSA